MVLLPRIDFNSLWILKGDLSATFADPFELITINFLNGDQPEKGRHAHQSRKVLRLPFAGNRGSPTRCLCARLLCHVGLWGWSEEVFFIHEGGFMTPRPPRSPTRRTRCAALQRCVRATLELYSQHRVWDLYWD
ncbi:hypothetical protein PoB_004137600 [Plakobranchus ocellatus]|uniref:Uncharacterized protein n=1 Tax=Plakobranchus ocellatus TaxID=259542 RepID=A0AAV4B2X6_9GAST|nr:hypothetical protein PoB_004137600 [Plakobranchus ocellatus]